MGGKNSAMREHYVDFRALFEKRDREALVKRFSDDCIVHFYNAQDPQPAVFRGHKGVSDFFDVYLRVFPECTYTLPDTEAKPRAASAGSQEAAHDDSSSVADGASSVASGSKEQPADSSSRPRAGSTGGSTAGKSGAPGEAPPPTEDEDAEHSAPASFLDNELTLLSSFFDEATRTAIVEFKFPQRGYRFIQETLVADGDKWQLLSITMDSATDFSGLAAAAAAAAAAAPSST